MVKNLPASARDTGGAGSIPGTGRSLGEGNGNPLQYSCLENPMDRGAWWTLVRRSWTERLSTHTRSMPPTCEWADVLVLLRTGCEGNLNMELGLVGFMVSFPFPVFH